MSMGYKNPVSLSINGKPYVVVIAFSPESLKILVSEWMLKWGYVPQGGIAFCPETDDTKQCFYQAMVKIEQPAKPEPYGPD